MHNLLTKFLRKKGLQDPQDLGEERLPDGSPSEREVFERWQEVLSKEKVEVDDIVRFIQSQIDVIEGKWADYANQNNEKLIPYHTCYKTILRLITSPVSARESLINYLEQLTQ